MKKPSKTASKGPSATAENVLIRLSEEIKDNLLSEESLDNLVSDPDAFLLERLDKDELEKLKALILKTFFASMVNKEKSMKDLHSDLMKTILRKLVEESANQALPETINTYHNFQTVLRGFAETENNLGFL